MTARAEHVSRHTFDGTMRVFAAEALFVPSALITAAYLTRKLGGAGYGELALAATIVAWLEWTTSSTFSRSTQTLVGAADDWRPVGATFLRLQLFAGLLVGLVLWLTSDAIAALLKMPSVSTYLRLYAAEVPLFCAVAAHRDILVGLGHFRQRATASAGRWIARPLIIVLLVSLGLSIQGAIIGSMAALVVELLIFRLHVRPSLMGRALAAVSVLGHTAPLFVYALVLRLVDKLDLFAVQFVSGATEQSGFYAAAQSIALAPALFALAFTPLLLSSLTRLLRTDSRIEAEQLVSQALRVPFLLLPVVALVAGAADGVIRLVFGDAFASAAPLLAPLLIAAMAFFTMSVCTAIVIAAGHVYLPMLLAAPLLPIAVLALAVTVPREGMIGAAAVTAAVASLGALASLVAVHRSWGLAPPLATILRALLLTAAAFVVGRWLPSSPALLVTALTGGLAFIGVAFILLREFTRGELEQARLILRR